MRDKTGRPVPTRLEGSRFHDLERRHPAIVPGTVSYIYSGQFRVTSKSASFTLSGEMVVLVDASACDITLTLLAASANIHKVYTIKKVDSSSHSITVKGATPSDTIDGEELVEMSFQYQYITITCDGSDWFIIGGEYVKMEQVLQEMSDELKLIRAELKENNLHLKSVTEEEITEEDKNGD